MLERAAAPDQIKFLLGNMASTDPVKQKNGIIALHTLIPILDHSTTSKFKILKQFVKFLYRTTDETMVTIALMSIYMLIKDNDKRKLKVVRYKIVPHLVKLAKTNGKKCGSNIYWIISILYQFSLTDSIVPVLINENVPYLLLNLATRKYGAINAQKFCIHALVRIISTLSDPEATSQLYELNRYGCLFLISASLRNSN